MDFQEQTINRLQEEVKYHRAASMEKTAVINQLIGKPSQPWIYIHPFDLYEILNNMPIDEIIPELIGLRGNDINDVFTYKGKKYKQSAHIPPTKIPKFL